MNGLYLLTAVTTRVLLTLLFFACSAFITIKPSKSDELLPPVQAQSVFNKYTYELQRVEHVLSKIQAFTSVTKGYPDLTDAEIVLRLGTDIEFVYSFARDIGNLINIKDYEYEPPVACNNMQLIKLEEGSASANGHKRALQILKEPKLLWAALESYLLRSAIDNKRAPNTSYADICQRIEKIERAIQCFYEKPNKCGAIEKQLNKLQVNIKKTGKQLEGQVIVVEPIYTTYKMRFGTYIEPYLQHLKITKQEKLLTNLSKRNTESVEAFVSSFITYVRITLTRRASIAAYSHIQAIPKGARTRVDAEIREQEIISKAAEAYKSIKKGEIDLKKGKFKESYSLEKEIKLQDTVARYVMDFSDSLDAIIVSSTEDIKRELQNVANNAKEQASAYVGDTVDELCRALEDVRPNITGTWNDSMLGIAPNKDRPYGARFVFNPDPAGKLRIEGVDRKLYKARLELLVRAPSALYQPKVRLPSGEEESCSNNVPADTFMVIDTGFVVSNVLKDLPGEDNKSQNNYVRFDSSSSDITVDSSIFNNAMQQLGLPIQWLTSKPNLELPNFSNATIWIELDGSRQKMPVLSDGKLVLNPKVFGLKFCENIKNNYIPKLALTWSESLSFGIDTWKASLFVKGGGGVELPTCRALYKQNESNPENQILKPLTSADMAADLNLVIEGEIAGTAFQWKALAKTVAKPNHIRLKSLILDETPPSILAHLQNKVDSLVDKIKTDGSAVTAILRTKRISMEVPGLFDIPAVIDVRVEGCGPTSVDLKITIDSKDASIGIVGGEDVLIKTLGQQATCLAENTIGEYLLSEVDCDDLKLDLLGITVVKVSNMKTREYGCEFDVSGTLFAQNIILKGVRAKASEGKLRVDIASVKIESDLISAIESESQRLLGSLADKGVKISNVRSDSDALVFEVTANPGEPFGEIALGSFLLRANGQFDLSSNIETILKKKAFSVIEKQLTDLARGVLPDDIKGLKVYPAVANGDLTVKASFGILFRENFHVIPFEIEVFPKLQVGFEIDEKLVKATIGNELTKYLSDLMPLKSEPFEIHKPVISIGPAYDIVIQTGITIGLSSLGSITLENISITKDGVDIAGRAELRVKGPIPIGAAPPIFITNPGIYYDFKKPEVGTLGDLTVVAPDFDKLFAIEADLSIGSPENFIESMSLTGELILVGSLPIATAKGNLDFKNISASYSMQTSQVLSKILNAQSNGRLDGKNGTASSTTELSVLGVDIATGNLMIDVRECPGRCIHTGGTLSLSIGNAMASVDMGPFLIDAILKMAFTLKVFDANFADAKLTLEALKAEVEFEAFDIFQVSVITPSIDQMTPDYIAAILASLFNVSLEDILNFLKNPKVRFVPAGSTGDGQDPSDNSGSESGNGSSAGKGKKSGSAEPRREPTSKEEERTEQIISPIPKDVDIPPQRRGVEGGNAFQACRDKDRSWGKIVFHRENYPHYHPIYTWLTPYQYELLCKPYKGKKAFRDTGAFTVISEFDQVNLSYSRLRTSDEAWKVLDPKSNNRTLIKGPLKHMLEVNLNDKGEHSTRRMFGNVPFKYQLINQPSSKEINAGYKIEISGDDLKRYEKGLAQPGVMRNQIISEITQRVIDAIVKDRGSEYKRIRRYQKESTSVYSRPITAGDIQIRDIRFKNTFSLGPFFRDADLVVSIDLVIPSDTVRGFGRFTLLTNADGRVLTLYQCLSEERSFVWFDPRPKTQQSQACNSHWINSQSSREEQDALDDRMKRVLVENGIRINENITSFTPDQTAWLLNDVIPVMVTNEGDIPDRGKPVSFDSVAGQCDEIKQLFAVETPNRIQIRILADKDSATQEIGTFAIMKYSRHASWASDISTPMFASIVSYFACKREPDDALRKHFVWLDTDSTDLKNTIVFSTIPGTKSDNNRSIKDNKDTEKVSARNDLDQLRIIRPNVKPQKPLVSRFDPYTARGGTGASLIITTRQQLLKDIVDSDTKAAILLVDKDRRIESYVRLPNKPTGDVILQLRDYDSTTSQTPLSGDAVSSITIREKDLEQCLIDLKIQEKSTKLFKGQTLIERALTMPNASQKLPFDIMHLPFILSDSKKSRCRNEDLQ